MDKKSIIVFGLLQIIVISGLIEFAAGNGEDIEIDEETAALCTGDCADCNSECLEKGECIKEGLGICQGSGTCEQTNQCLTKDTSNCYGSGSCRQQSYNKEYCYQKSGCSTLCNN